MAEKATKAQQLLERIHELETKIDVMLLEVHKLRSEVRELCGKEPPEDWRDGIVLK